MAGPGRLLRYLAVLGPKEEAFQEPKEGSVEAVTLERFPLEDDDVPLSPLLGTLPDFCFKDGVTLSKEKPNQSPSFASFVFSTDKGGRLHVACLTVHERRAQAAGHVYAPKALCLVSLYPCLELLRSLLSDLVLAARYDETRSAGDEERLVPRLLAQMFYELPMPPNRHTMVTLTAGFKELGLLDPSGLTRDFSFRPLVAFLSVTRLAQLFVLTLQERKVVLTSQNLSPLLLVVILEALRALLFPLEWEHTYLPILPSSFRWALESPAPFLMGVSGKLSSSELPDDVVVFDLDTGKSMPEKPQVAVPSVIEQPLARLKNAHQWEQRQANKEYWAKYDHVRVFPRARTGSGDVETSPESPRGRVRHRRSLSSSAESGEESDGILSHSSGLSGALGPVWTEDQEKSFRQKVAAIFLEALVLLLHRSPELKLKEDLPEPVAQESEKALLEEVRRSNAWERFTALASNSPRRQLFDQAIRLYMFWSQEPSESRKPLEHNLRDWVTRLYEPPQLICLSEASALRCGSIQPQLPIRKMLQRIARRRSRYEALGDLKLSKMEAEVKKEETTSCLGVPRSVALRLPNVTSFSLGRSVNAEHGLKHLPSDAVKHFRQAMPKALEEVRSLLSKGNEGEFAWMDSAEKKKQEQLKPRLPNFLAQLVMPQAEFLQLGPHLEMSAACHVHGLREARSRCQCGWLNSLWDSVTSAIQGNTRNDAHCCVSCNQCGAVLEPMLTLRKRLPKPVIDRSHSELSISTVGEMNTQIHLLNLQVCLDRIVAKNLQELTEEKLLEEDPEVYWCLQLFYGLRAEIWWRKGLMAPVALASTGFHSMCRSYAAAKKQEARAAGAALERSPARLPTTPRQEEFAELAKKGSTRRNKSTERTVQFEDEPAANGRSQSRRPIRTVTLKDIGHASILNQDDEESDDSVRRRRPGRKATEPKSGIAFVHVNMEVHVEPVIEPGERPTLLSRPRAAPELSPGRTRPRKAPASPKRAARRRSPEPGARPARRVQRPLVLAPHRPCQLQPGEGYAKEPRDRQVPARVALEEQLVSDIVGLSTRIDELRKRLPT